MHLRGVTFSLKPQYGRYRDVQTLVFVPRLWSSIPVANQPSNQIQERVFPQTLTVGSRACQIPSILCSPKSHCPQTPSCTSL
jgi:hypothetical protein